MRLDQARASRQITWQVAHETLSRLARARAAADAEEGRWLLAAQRAAAHVHLGFGCFSEYIGRLFGYQPRSVQEKLRVAEALEHLPALEHALSTGELHWSAVRELTRIALRETEREWLEFARGKTLRQLEQALAGQEPGALPSSPPNPAVQRHVLRFDVAAETFALFRDALNELRRRAGGPLDDDGALLEMARAVLGGPRDEGRASYQIVLDVCSACGAGRQQASGGLVPIGPDVLRMAHCDAQHLAALTEPSPPPANDFEPHSDQAERDGAHATEGSDANVDVLGEGVAALAARWRATAGRLPGAQPASLGRTVRRETGRRGTGRSGTPRAAPPPLAGSLRGRVHTFTPVLTSRSPRRCAGPCCCALSAAAKCRAVPITAGSISIIELRSDGGAHSQKISPVFV